MHNYVSIYVCVYTKVFYLCTDIYTRYIYTAYTRLITFDYVNYIAMIGHLLYLHLSASCWVCLLIICSPWANTKQEGSQGLLLEGERGHLLPVGHGLAPG